MPKKPRKPRFRQPRRAKERPSKQKNEVLIVQSDVVKYLGENHYLTLSNGFDDLPFPRISSDRKAHAELFQDPSFISQVVELREKARECARSININGVLQELLYSKKTNKLVKLINYSSSFFDIKNYERKLSPNEVDLLYRIIVAPLLYEQILNIFRKFQQTHPNSGINLASILRNRVATLASSGRTLTTGSRFVLEFLEKYTQTHDSLQRHALLLQNPIMQIAMTEYSSSSIDREDLVKKINKNRQFKSEHKSESSQEIKHTPWEARVSLHSAPTDKMTPPYIAVGQIDIQQSKIEGETIRKENLYSFSIRITCDGNILIARTEISFRDIADPALYNMLESLALEHAEKHFRESKEAKYKTPIETTTRKISIRALEIIDNSEEQKWTEEAINTFGKDNLERLEELAKDDRLDFVDRLREDGILDDQEALDYVSLFPEYIEYRQELNQLANSFFKHIEKDMDKYMKNLLQKNPREVSLHQLILTINALALEFGDNNKKTHKNYLLYLNFANIIIDKLLKKAINSIRLPKKTTRVERISAYEPLFIITTNNHLSTVLRTVQVATEIKNNLSHRGNKAAINNLPSSKREKTHEQSHQDLIKASQTKNPHISETPIKLQNGQTATLKIITSEKQNDTELCYGYLRLPGNGNHELDNHIEKRDNFYEFSTNTFPFSIDKTTGEINLIGSTLSYQEYIRENRYKRLKDLIYNAAERHYKISPDIVIKRDAAISLLDLESKNPTNSQSTQQNEEIQTAITEADYRVEIEPTYQYIPYERPQNDEEKTEEQNELEASKQTITLSHLDGYKLSMLKSPLKKCDIVYVRDGKGSHRIYKGPNGLNLPIPDHGIVGPKLLKKNLEMWGVDPYDFYLALKNKK